MDTQYIAHAKQMPDGEWAEPHLLEEHLRAVAKLARDFAAVFAADEWGTLSGIWHDLGKYRDAFQEYIRDKSGFERENAHVEQTAGRVTHSTAGAIHAINQLGPGYGHIIAYLIAGHHAGLPDWWGGLGSLSYRLSESQSEYDEAVAKPIPSDMLEGTIPALPETAQDSNSASLWMRMLFSCLVDADFLDTEAYMSPEEAVNRESGCRIMDLSDKFFRSMERMQRQADPTPLNHIRSEIFKGCLRAADETPGIFSLTVPTGGGKTLSSLAFALRHAQKHGKSRIIYAIPFTSIIEQNASVFRDVLGEDAVLEHHSNLDSAPDHETSGSRLATENWNAPLIVTTNVQLFESLFASRTSRCRKLHNLVNSIVILDEAQQLPRDFHRPITQVMRQMSQHFGVTWLLCTATQPELGQQKDAFNRVQVEGLDDVREVVREPSELAQQLRRVEITMPPPDADPMSWERLAAELAEEPCVLVIVNTRKNARELYGLLPESGDKLHLSASMCAEHRSAIIRQIRVLLAERRAGSTRPLRVVSTQLIEAGVDVDFPVVYRAMAGLDSIAQAAGRCNREGRISGLGRVQVFIPPQSAPPGFLRQGEQTTHGLWKGGQLDDPLSPESFQRYFSALNRLGSRDKYNICELLRAKQTADSPLDISFREAAKQFRMIDNNGIAVIVPYRAVSDKKSPIYQWLSMLDADPLAKWIYRKLQRFSVTVPENFAKQLEAAGVLYNLAGQFVVEESHYHERWGIQPPDALLSAEEMIF